MTTPQSGVHDPGGFPPDEREQPGGPVAHAVRKASGKVADTTSDEAGRVAGDAKRQGRRLAGEVGDRVNQQVDRERGRAVDLLRTAGGELRDATASGQSPLTEALVGRTGQYAEDLAAYLDKRSVGEVLDDVRRFARQRPGLFLLGAAAAGVVVGRLTRGAVAAHREPGERQ